MNILFFDAETTGFLDRYNRLSYQPHLVQLGALLVDHDQNVFDEMTEIVKPDGWEIPENAANIHGITTDMADTYGKPLNDVLGKFMTLSLRADIIVSYNYEFDGNVIKIEMIRTYGADSADKWRSEKSVSYCPMRLMTNLCKIPFVGNPNKYRYPNMMESYEFLFHKKYDDPHTAFSDVLALKDIFFELVKRDMIG